MLAGIERHVRENDTVSALQECLNRSQYFLGMFLGRLRPDNSPKYFDLMAKLEQEAGKKKEDPPKIRVRLLCNWLTSEQLVAIWNKMSQGNGCWNGLQIVPEEPADFYVIVNAPPTGMKAGEHFDPKRTVLIRMEPNMATSGIWGEWSNPKSDQFLRVLKYEEGDYNNVEWHISKTYTELKTLEIRKTKVLSTVLSEKYKDPGQVKRIDFVKFLENKGLVIDVYGSNKWDYKNYKDSLPYHCKDNAILPYKYTFNVENFSLKNYFTEKLVDGILGECLVFYSGCFNIREYFDERAFVYLELSNFEADYQTVKKAIEEDWHTKRLPYIREAKRKILEEYQFFPRLEKILKERLP